MSYLPLARQFRPQTFSQVTGQTAILTTLRHALQYTKHGQAYLFSGCRGTGKTTLARLFSKALNCKNLTSNFEPCNGCSSCKDIAAGNSLDVLEIDGASHRGIEDIRQINEAVHFSPVNGNFKIYLVDEVHMLTKEAFNALLKTLEEPPKHVKFFFCTTEPHKIPATILSRCQHFQLARLPEELIIHNLSHIATQLNVSIKEASSLQLIARLADGSLRDAQSLFDQVLAFCDGAIDESSVRTVLGFPSQELFQLLDQAKGNYEVAFEIIQQLYATGKSPLYFLEELAHHFKEHLLRCRGILPAAQSDYRQEQLLDIMELLQEAMVKIKSVPSERVYLEMLLLNILRTHERLNPREIIQKLELLEQRIENSAHPTPIAATIPSATTVKKQESAAPSIASKRIEKPTQSTLQEPVKTAPSTMIKKPEVKTPTVEKATKPSSPPLPKLDATQRGRVDTLMRFAAKELNGNLKMES